MAEREQLDDRALVTRILEGDRDRFTELVRRYEKRLINYVYRITHRYEEAHDLAQEIFVKVYLALDRYDPKYQFSTWLFRIAQNASIDALRKKSLPEVPLARPSDDEQPKYRELYGSVGSRSLRVDALPLAPWEGASYRSWPLVIGGALALLAIAFALCAAAGISLMTIVRAGMSAGVVRGYVTAGADALRAASLIWQIAFGFAFILVNTV